MLDHGMLTGPEEEVRGAGVRLSEDVTAEPTVGRFEPCRGKTVIVMESLAVPPP